MGSVFVIWAIVPLVVMTEYWKAAMIALYRVVTYHLVRKGTNTQHGVFRWPQQG